MIHNQDEEKGPETGYYKMKEVREKMRGKNISELKHEDGREEAGAT